jgi:hypothetical protein
VSILIGCCGAHVRQPVSRERWPARAAHKVDKVNE